VLPHMKQAVAASACNTARGLLNVSTYFITVGL